MLVGQVILRKLGASVKRTWLSGEMIINPLNSDTDDLNIFDNCDVISLSILKFFISLESVQPELKDYISQ